MPASAAPSSVASARWLRPFVRVTSGGRFVPEIDGLRAVAIGSVLLFHLAVDLQAKSTAWTIPASGLLATPARFGFRGVELFFVISGFVLGLPFAAHHLCGRKPVDLSAYFLRRLTRLEPPYLIAMVGIFLALVLFHGQSGAGLAAHLAASSVYQHGLIFAIENPINNVAWSLEVEVQFYLLAPLLSMLFAIRDRRLRRGAFVALILGSATCSALFVRPDTRLWLSIGRFLHFFLGGFLLADVFLVDWDEAPSHDWRWDAGVLVSAPLLLLVMQREGPPGSNGEPLAALLALAIAAPMFGAAVFRSVWLNRILTKPWVTVFGGMCYSIYLLHNPVLGVILTRTHHWHPTGRWALDLLTQAAISMTLLMLPVSIFFLLVEKPCMQRDWPRRLWLRVQVRREKT